MTTEDLTGTWRDTDGTTRRIAGRAPHDLCWIDDTGYHWTPPVIARWSRVSDAAPTETGQPAPWCPSPPGICIDSTCEVHPKPAPVLPSDVRDGDLLTGTLYGNPFTDWTVVRPFGDIYFGNLGQRHLYIGCDVWISGLILTARKPAPSPLPWEQPNAAPYWRSSEDGFVIGLSAMRVGKHYGPDDEWAGGYFVPADLIERVRDADVQRGSHYEPSDYVRKIYRAILDAAGGA